MATKANSKDKAWAIFDQILIDAEKDGLTPNPWIKHPEGDVHYRPDYSTLSKLLGVPLYLQADTRTGVPALSLDVWLSYELRRAGFDSDATWPRGSHPRILPKPIANLLKAVPAKERATLNSRINRNSAIAGVTASSANILGKNYLKQVDVIMTDWATGPELLISTKRMDSSYAKNAANRVEESYGDAKNLRLRHPLAALGFVFGLRSDILHQEPETAEWLTDLIDKLGREDDAYNATCLIFIDYENTNLLPDDSGEDPEDPLVAAGLLPRAHEVDQPMEVPDSHVDHAILNLPTVRIRLDETPHNLRPDKFLSTMIRKVLTTTPVNFHKEARKRLNQVT